MTREDLHAAARQVYRLAKRNSTRTEYLALAQELGFAFHDALDIADLAFYFTEEDL